MLRPATMAMLCIVLAAVPADARSDVCERPSIREPSTVLSRTDHQLTGNRVACGSGPLAGEAVDIALAGAPAWILPDPGDPGTSWLVALDDGTVARVVAPAGGTPFVEEGGSPALEPGEPPQAAMARGGQLVVDSALSAAERFEDAIPDARVTMTLDLSLVALTGPTSRYAHGVLGDDLEASSVDVIDPAGSVMRIAVGPAEVIEGLSAMAVELTVDSEGQELVVTVSDAELGARLVVHGLDGELLASSEPIGQGYRWLHQIGAGRIGPDDVIEIIAVRTPHIGGVVEAYRLVDDRLELAASLPGYSSHRLASANLDMALLADLDGDGRLDIVVPEQGLTVLGVLARTATGFEPVDRLPLDGVLATNVAAADVDGKLVLAAGTTDGRVRIFR